MRKALLTLSLLTICSFGFAQDMGKTYINLNYSGASIKQKHTAKISNNFGAGFTVGHTYYLHKEPVGDIFRFGLDATWFDINYNNFSYDYTDLSDSNRKTEETIHEGEVGMQIGPSVTITPADKLDIRAYFRYAPSCAVLYDSIIEEVSCNYASMFVGGVSVNYGIIGVGIETRFGSSKLNEYKFEDNGHGDIKTDKISTKLSGFRAYLSFRF